MDPFFSKVIINDAYKEPGQHLNLLRQRAEDEEILPGRRPAGYFVGARSDPGQVVAEKEWKELRGVNKIRERVGRWRAAGFPGVTPVTKALLDCWRKTDRPRINLFFCQREAVETIIWLTEAPESDRAGLDDVRAPDPFLRYCSKMATGSGKTTVMAMLAAWSVINKVTNRQDPRFSDAVLAVCPNLTVRERLQVLFPSNPKNDYEDKGLIPSGTDFMERLAQGKFQISNWHQLAALDAVPNAIRSRDPDQRRVAAESDAAFSRRVLHDLGKKDNLLVFNDEAHHAYRKNPEAREDGGDQEELLEVEDAEEFEREATVWVEGLDRIHRDRKIRLCVDLSATPYYIARSGYEDGLPFPWIVSDFGLVDAVESGIVKVPLVPKKDDSGDPEPRFLHLWEHIKSKLPKRVAEGEASGEELVRVLMEAEGALQNLSHLWKKTFKTWKGDSEIPPCMIVVCNNTRTAEVIADFIGKDGGIGEEFRNTEKSERTLRIDSALLRRAESEGGGEVKAEFLRKKVATVGKPGGPEESPGGQTRCVVSVAMLSEGWDARNVTQILGLRAFSSQLLCEQVIGRGLRRASYENLAEPEFVDIYGIPFQLLPVQKHAPGGTHKPTTHVRALADRSEFEITFPHVVGYFPDVTTELVVDESKLEPLELSSEDDPGYVEAHEGVSYYGGAPARGGVSMVKETVEAKDVYEGRLQTAIYKIAQKVVQKMPEQHRPYLFKRVRDAVRRFVDTKVIANGQPKEKITLLRYQTAIVDRLLHALRTETGEAVELPIYDLFKQTGTTAGVSFVTRKPHYATRRSHVNYVVCDPGPGHEPLKDAWPRLWEYRVAEALDGHKAVVSFVKNDHLDFGIPYTHEAAEPTYYPDFIVVLSRADGSEVKLILEVKGQEDNKDRAKYTGARRWVAAVNRDAKHGEWAFEVIRDPGEVHVVIERTSRE